MTRFGKTKIFLSLAFALQVSGCAAPQVQQPTRSALAPAKPLSAQDPSELYAELFVDVQTTPLYEDSKYFVDMIPREAPSVIVDAYREEKPKKKAQLLAFVEKRFLPPADRVLNVKSGRDIDAHIKQLWKDLKRAPDEEGLPAASLIPLPRPYVVPGGRFREIYYWDSYFTQLGLLADGEDELFRDMVENFAHLLRTTGRIPNGNRDYYRGRSQPPFFSHMIALWRAKYGAEAAAKFLPELKKEHDFWMSGAADLKPGEAKARVVRLEDGVLNRYWDDEAAPRPEAYKEDVALAKKAATLFTRNPGEVYRDLRAGAESGWDYSTRWFRNPLEFASIQTTAYLPVDLNALLYHLEMEIAYLSIAAAELPTGKKFVKLAADRLALMHRYFWDEKSGMFRDYDWRSKSLSAETTVAMVVPLFTGSATKDQAKRVTETLRKKLLKPGGLVTTEHVSGQQWDAPNGWPPHQWMAYAGLKRFGEDALAEAIRKRWLDLNRKVFRKTGKLMEKYNVIDLSLESGGGEYPTQDGFGWTNGVYRALSTPEKSRKHLGW